MEMKRRLDQVVIKAGDVHPFQGEDEFLQVLGLVPGREDQADGPAEVELQSRGGRSGSSVPCSPSRVPCRPTGSRAIPPGCGSRAGPGPPFARPEPLPSGCRPPRRRSRSGGRAPGRNRTGRSGGYGGRGRTLPPPSGKGTVPEGWRPYGRSQLRRFHRRHEDKGMVHGRRPHSFPFSLQQFDHRNSRARSLQPNPKAMAAAKAFRPPGR